MSNHWLRALLAALGLLVIPASPRAQELDAGVADGDAGPPPVDGGSLADAGEEPAADEPTVTAEATTPETEPSASPPATGPFLTPYTRRARVRDGFRVLNGAVSGELIGGVVVLGVATVGALLVGGGMALYRHDAGVLGEAIALTDTHPATWTVFLAVGGTLGVGFAYREGNNSRWKTPLAPLLVAGLLGTGGCVTLAWLTLDPQGYGWEWPMVFSTMVAPLLGTPVLLTITHAIFRKPQPYWERHAPVARRRRPRLEYLPPTTFALRSVDRRQRLVPAISLGTLVF